MGRKKTSEAPELKLGSEDTQVINASDIEATEAELLDEQSDDSADDSEVKAKAEVPQDKPKRQRRPRKTAAVLESSTTSEIDLGLQKEVEIARETVQVTMGTMVAQFNVIKDISSGLNVNLEKMTDLIRQISPTQSSNLEELAKPPTNHAFISKFATAASLVAVLLSVLSLSLSQ